MNHYRKTIHVYKKRQKNSGCPFCEPDIVKNAVYEDDLVYIVPNLTQYDLWELHDVEEHLLLIPKRHVETLKDLNESEKLAVIGTAAEYEARGYNIYARGVGFVKRSIKHQHTHLIKVSNKKPNAAFFLQRPYFLFKK